MSQSYYKKNTTTPLGLWQNRFTECIPPLELQQIITLPI